jgi:hypothetical protein
MIINVGDSEKRQQRDGTPFPVPSEHRPIVSRGGGSIIQAQDRLTLATYFSLSGHLIMKYLSAARPVALTARLRSFLNRSGIPSLGLLLAVLLSGCSGGNSGGQAAGGGGGSASNASVKSYAVNQLPPASLDLPPLDGGRLEVPTPDKWAPLSQKKEYVVAFQVKGRTGFPQIVITAEDVEHADVTKENVAAYAAEVQAKLDAQMAAKQVLVLEPAKAIVLGRNAYARYVLKGRKQGKDVATLERQMLRTVRGGRQYTIDLTVTDDLTAHRDHAYALGAGIRFIASDEPPAGKSPGKVEASEAGEAPAAEAAAAEPAESSKKGP